MIEHYLQIRQLHMGAAFASGVLFLIRAIAVNLGARWPMAAPLRYLSYAIDTTLLTGAVVLMTLSHQYPFVQGWLTVKVLLVAVYIVLGSFALKRARGRAARLAFTAAAVATYLTIVSIAFTHSPWGFLSRLV